MQAELDLVYVLALKLPNYIRAEPGVESAECVGSTFSVTAPPAVE